MKIILATHNKDKYTEMSKILKNYPIDILSLGNFPDIKEIIEDGSTLKENALIKAKTIHSKTGLYAWADDTGLEVDALNGEPGIYSARYAGENCNYIDNVNKLLKNMKNIPNNLRTAQFRTCVAFVGKNLELVAYGAVKGLITKKMKGLGGFGYDPVFYVPIKNKTYSEMKMKEKNQISHRAKAINNMLVLLQNHFPNIFYQLEDIA